MLFIYLLHLVKTKVDDEGVAIVRSLEKRSGVYKSQDGDAIVEEKKSKIKQHIYISHVLSVHSSYDIIIIYYNQCSGNNLLDYYLKL